MNSRQGKLENRVLNALWRLEENGQENIDVTNVQNIINSKNKQWAYTTVKTVLDRLVEKNVITRFKIGKKYSYKSDSSRDELGEAAIKKLAKQYFNGDMEELYSAVKNMLNEVVTLSR